MLEMRLIAGKAGVAGALALALLCAASVRPGFAAGAARYCASGTVGKVAIAVPRKLGPLVAETFAIGVDQARESAYVRCAGGKLMACWVGANLDCGRANVHRSLLGANAYCRDNPGSDSIPMAATGHDTIYDWKCDGKRAVAGKANRTVDAQGYIADNWKEVP
jgi:hypothetical protein